MPTSASQARALRRAKDPYYKSRMRAYNKRRIVKLREMVLAAKDRPCADCGISFPYYVMDLDHVRGEKKFGIGSLRSVKCGYATFQTELDKCEAVCANCHRVRTHVRRINSAEVAI